MRVKTPAPAFQPCEVTCSCKAVLEVEFSDLKRRHHEADPRDPRESSWDEVYVECPECRCTIQFKNLPDHLVKRIPAS